MADERASLIDKLTDIIVNALEGENQGATDNLNFSVWAAAFATAASGLILTHGHTIAERSWMGPRRASAVLLVTQILLFASILLAGVVRHAINRQLSTTRDLADYYRMQAAEADVDQQNRATADLFLALSDGVYLGEIGMSEVRKDLDLRTRWGRRARLLISAQLVLIGFSYGAVLIAGLSTAHPGA